MNETTELIMKQLNQKKTHAVTHEVGGGDEIDATKLKNIGNYLETDGDFTGTWNGYEMTSVDAGLATAFDVLQEDVSQRAINVTSTPYTADATGVTDSTTTIQAAINAVSVAGGGNIYIPQGTFLVSLLTIPSNIRILTSGKSTIIKQTSGTALGTRVINVTGSNVTIGDMTVEGNIATDTNEQNHAIYIKSLTETISNIHIGVIYGKNLRGDVVYVGGYNGFAVKAWSVKGIVCDNVYRNGLSVTGGQGGQVGFIIGNNVGLMMFDIEPDSLSTACRDIRIGYVRGGQVGVLGYQSTVVIEGIQIDSLDMDPSFQANSSPAYSFYDVDDNAMLLRNTRGLRIGNFKANNYDEHAIKVIKEASDIFCQNIIIDRVNWVNCSITEATYSSCVQGVGLESLTINGGKVTLYDATKYVFMGNSSDPTLTRVSFEHIEVLNGKVARYVSHSLFNDINVSSATSDGFQQVHNSTVRNSTVTTQRLAAFCSKVTFENVTATASSVIFDGSNTDHFIINSTLNSVYIKYGPYLRQHQNSMYFGGQYIWVDTNSRPRIQNTAPSSDTGGTPFNMGLSGVTVSRPTTGLYVGLFYFDTTLGKPIWVKTVAGPVWVDATGTTV